MLQSVAQLAYVEVTSSLSVILYETLNFKQQSILRRRPFLSRAALFPRVVRRRGQRAFSSRGGVEVTDGAVPAVECGPGSHNEERDRFVMSQPGGTNIIHHGRIVWMPATSD